MKKVWLWFNNQPFCVKLVVGAVAIFVVSTAAALLFSIILSLVASAILYPRAE